MQSLRTYALVGFVALSLFFLAACGSTTTYSSSSATPTATTQAQQDTGSNAYGNGPSAHSTPTTGTGNATSPLIKTVTVTVSGKSEAVLANAQGLTLYYFTPDTATTSACTAGCASTWPPLLATGSSKPTAAASVAGKLTALSTENGQQVQYNGHFLYTYSGDSASGQTNGQGLGGKWFVATPTLS